MSAEQWASSLDELHALGNPFLALQGSGSSQLEQANEVVHEQPVHEDEPMEEEEATWYKNAEEEEEVEAGEALEEGSEEEQLEAPAGSQEEIDKFFNDPEFLAAESTVAKSMQVPWALRGPRQGPGEGGPTTWRGSTWRPTTKKWVKRGGRNLKYWSQLYSKNAAKAKSSTSSACGKGSSSSSSRAVWIPNPKGKGGSNDDWDARGRARAGL